ncbi:Asp-tRNA(Asn)/Glu-tRNA(Gln) amidotransferase subunit GatC [Legionella longbeachae]|uniref:Aspartyl/glutamyl-tRNA(Asn/Gln) amidotransferase subunit C n=1 Tax=Legionella longbeachae serogroup 1 (strain NSW150) TaxID=661367 RepID=D3HJV4_LEGLN|nr:Asp-tRNA(Asn)/Glu-tRNA(Gln) amidotransferase subunit GatC [Legionella longbeachae]VEE03234.1 glutamyl-tRNA(Gln) amidotransferase subunit C [Legionella oakridgensis]HBD7398595.1 Asp-tRNA(Asn)/Glu-tRNA(Gln) amidotransferase subunit GatC [Legionella pneumophila]ARB93868.1 Asp-tRNA(Asn)/Glu-tRNA(Gln) amidotransferase subunit GatC [Legionella longbeachae]ARM32993.1 Asp-tRNA(Asn)/Glu-tRNA(Gln) amidotransferase subunit GatC [Legionella longbeachae]EEZ94178.1 aspartyl/glutamyl-tRNA(Asn/Gln) amidotr
MTISVKELEKISKLAYLDTDIEHSPKLIEDINAIMNFVDQLRAINTHGVEPLFHPLALNQYLRPDVVTEETCVTELAALAPKFENELYLVPQVIEQSK